MNEANRNYIVVGAFVLTMLVILILWFVVLSGTTASTDRYYILWDNVMGLKDGTQILYEGYPFGLIDDIEKLDGTDPEGKNYRVNIRVREGWQIPDSAFAETTAPSFLSALVVNIQAGDSESFLEPGSRVAEKESSDLLSAAGDVLVTVTETLESLKPKLQKITDSVSAVLNDENATQITSMLETLNVRISEILSSANAERIESILTNLDRVSSEAANLTVGLKKTKGQIDTVLRRVDKLMEEHSDDLGHSLVDLHASLETVSRHIDAIANNLEDATRDFGEFTGQLRENPSVILRGRGSADDDSGASRQ
jgi:phospholipid/cholesterol/gamma-HCH transport system substrate-binding protein